jgi:capsular exopolysaccharide synthesis family protein
MSRIDDALRVWEKDKAVAPDLSARFEVDAYANESPTNGSRAPHDRVQTPVAVPPAPADPPAARIGSLNAEVEARLVVGGAGSVSLEQYRRLAAVLHDIQLQQGLRTLMLTSALPAEGKTLTTANLALTLSESYERRVLVVDADLRWPSLHKMFGLANGPGLSEALRSGTDYEPVIHRISPRLSLVAAGSPGLTPLAGLTSSRMGELIEQWSTRFDWVVFDTPPIGLLPDAQLLARLTRAVVFVIAAGQTPSRAVERAVSELGSDCIIGTVLNRVDNRRIPEAGYYARYGYGYYKDPDHK